MSLTLLKNHAKQFQEIIIALLPPLSGIVTSNYIKQILNNIILIELTQTIPPRTAVGYAYPLSLKATFINHKGLK